MILNSYISARQVQGCEVNPVPGTRESDGLFWVSFPLGGGWAINAMVEAERDQAEQMARQEIRDRWPQWEGII